MDKMRMESVDITDQNIEKIGALFPNVITEAKDESGKLTKAINFDLLKQELSKEVIECDEAYEFTWPGKKQAIVDANKSLRKTLRPCVQDSVDWDNTENLYIEGDNIEALKLLQGSYLGKIKLIYIDPPYNTGNDFIYDDDYSQTKEEFELEAGVIDSDGNVMYKNTDSNPRFHSAWCSIMYKTLLLARPLLSRDGCIFISIDDNEQANLKKICDEVFGADNFVNCIAVKMSEASGVKMNHAKTRFPKLKEYLLFYKMPNFEGFVEIDKYKQDIWDQENNIFLEGLAKTDREELIQLEEKEQKTHEDIARANEILKKATIVPLATALKEYQIQESTKDKWLFENSYRIIKTAGSSSLAALVKKIDQIPNQDIAAAISNDGVLFFYITKFNRETRQPRLQVIFADSNIYKNPCDFWQDIKTTGAIANEGGVKYNNGKKPLKLLNRIIKMTTTENDIILDFFAGSASTAHAVMNLNAKDGNNRKFIMIQINEDLDESLKKAEGSNKKTIKETIQFLDSINKPHILSELGKERIRRSGSAIQQNLRISSPIERAESMLGTPGAFYSKNELEYGKKMAESLDIGFRVLKVDDSNMTDVYYSADLYDQNMLNRLESNIKPDRTDLDLLFGCLLEWGLPLSMPYVSEDIEGCKVHTYNDGDLIACFDNDIPEQVIKEIAKRKPLRAVFRDSGFRGSPEKINVGERFKLLSPDTRVKII